MNSGFPTREGLGGESGADGRASAAPPRRFPPCTRWVWIWLAFAVAFATPARSEDRPPTESEVRSAYVYRFTQHFKWPAEAFATNTAPFVVKARVSDEFAADLRVAFQGKSVGSHPIVLEIVRGIPTNGPCHVFLWFEGDFRRLEEQLSRLRGPGLLTIGGAKDFLAAGGGIVFAADGKWVKFDVNRPALEEAGLQAEASLLKVARKVRNDPLPPLPPKPR
jgi:hypothetical protein